MKNIFKYLTLFIIILKNLYAQNLLIDEIGPNKPERSTSLAEAGSALFEDRHVINQIRLYVGPSSIESNKGLNAIELGLNESFAFVDFCESYLNFKSTDDLFDFCKASSGEYFRLGVLDLDIFLQNTSQDNLKLNMRNINFSLVETNLQIEEMKNLFVHFSLVNIDFVNERSNQLKSSASLGLAQGLTYKFIVKENILHVLVTIDSSLGGKDFSMLNSNIKDNSMKFNIGIGGKVRTEIYDMIALDLAHYLSHTTSSLTENTSAGRVSLLFSPAFELSFDVTSTHRNFAPALRTRNGTKSERIHTGMTNFEFSF